LIAIFLHQILKAAGVAGGCDEAITRCEHGFSDVAAQTACASRYQPDFRHIFSCFDCCLFIFYDSQAEGSGIMSSGLRTGFDAGWRLPATFFFRLLFGLLSRFIPPQ
jgi:hypothetical protein